MDFNEAAHDISRRDDAQFDADIQKVITQSEDMRISLMKTYQMRSMIAMAATIIFVLIGVAGFGWYLMYEGKALLAILSMLAAILIPFLMHLWAEVPLKTYKKNYKELFMPKLAEALGGFKFYPSRGISRKLVQKTGVVPAHEIYKAEDCFMGVYNGVKLIFSEARLYPGTRLADPVFDGLFFLMETKNETIQGHSILTSDYNMIGHYASQRWRQLQPVPLTKDKEIDVDFKLFSTKRHHGERLDDLKLLQELAEASDIFGKAPITLVAFGKRYVFLMIPYSHNMFEPSNIHIPVQTRQHAIQCRREIEQILEIIDVSEVF